MSRKALVIDDHCQTDLLVKLAKHGFKIDLAGNGTDAIRLSSYNKYDLVVLDYDLPDMKGEWIAAEIRRNDDDLYIIGYSSGWNDDNASYCALDDYTCRTIDGCIEKYFSSRKKE